MTRRTLALLLVAFALPGCAPRREYLPDLGAVQIAGVVQARRELSEILLRSREPRVDRAEVYTEYFRYWVADHPEGRAVFLQDVLSVEIYGEDRIVVVGPAGRVLDSLRLAGAADAERFADLVMSFREAFLRGEMIERLGE